MSAHLGVKLAIGIVGEDPPISRIVRKQRHHKFATNSSAVKKREAKYGVGNFPARWFSKPNYQELLTDLRVVVRLDSGEEAAAVKLTERVAIALSRPSQITRFGGLSLGESWAMVNGIRAYRETDGSIRWLVKDSHGLISLPVWINRKTSQGTFQRFSLSNDWQEDCWITLPKLPESVPTTTTKTTQSKQSRRRAKSTSN